MHESLQSAQSKTLQAAKMQLKLKESYISHLQGKPDAAGSVLLCPEGGLVLLSLLAFLLLSLLALLPSSVSFLMCPEGGLVLLSLLAFLLLSLLALLLPQFTC
jgi:fatty acid desaturase